MTQSKKLTDSVKGNAQKTPHEGLPQDKISRPFLHALQAVRAMKQPTNKKDDKNKK